MTIQTVGIIGAGQVLLRVTAEVIQNAAISI